MIPFILILFAFAVGCSQKKIVWKEPEIIIGEEYYKKDGSKCREIKIVKKFEDRTEIKVKEVCVR